MLERLGFNKDSWGRTEWPTWFGVLFCLFVVAVELILIYWGTGGHLCSAGMR
jgi:hypothetical protein